MRISAVLLASALSLTGCKGDADKAFADYSAAYTPAYEQYRNLKLRDVQEAIWGAGDAGKPLQAEHDALKQRADEIEALLNDANKQASDGRAKGDAALVKKGTDLLAEARKKSDALKPEIAALAAKVPAAAPAGGSAAAGSAATGSGAPDGSAAAGSAGSAAGSAGSAAGSAATGSAGSAATP